MRSIQGRLLALLLGLMLLIWAAVAASTWVDVRHELDELLDSHLAQAAALLVVQQVGEGDDDDHGGLDAPQLHRYAPRVAFQVWHEGRLVMRSSNAPTTPLLTGATATQGGFETVAMEGERWRMFAARGAERDVRVFVGELQGARTDILLAVLHGTLTPLALALPLLAVAAWLAVRQGLQPLRRLSRTLGKRPPQAMDPIEVRGAPSEMVPMMGALNDLLQRIGAMMAFERRFTADAAHELRTPIAAIRAQAQVALAETDDGARRHALLHTLQGCDRATRLVGQLLTLSRLEVTALPLAANLDLAALTRQVAAELAPLAIGRRQSLSVQAAAPCRMRGDETLLAVLVRNLIDNALRYSPEDATIEVQVQGQPGQIVLRVQDSGPGLPAADRARLGERFFRALGNDGSGSGLGWSIVQRIATGHGATVEIGKSTTLGGLCVTVTLPAA